VRALLRHAEPLGDAVDDDGGGSCDLLGHGQRG
jgi:hypothetical protein